MDSTFGFGPATKESRWKCVRGARLREQELGGGSLELVDRDTAYKLLPAIHDASRQRRVGDVRTYLGRWHDLISGDGQSDRFFLVHRDESSQPDGYAIYRLERDERFSSDATLVVEGLIASAGTAYRSMWSYLLDVDLTEQIVAVGRPEHEALQWMLLDHRQLVTTEVQDHLWVRLIDLPAALAMRRYGAEGSLVLDVVDEFCPRNEGRWRLEGGPDGAECRRAGGSEETDLRMDASVLASMYLGGAPLNSIVDAGRIEGSARALGTAAAMFGSAAAPWCSLGF
jgi:predicted acetyltransferase